MPTRNNKPQKVNIRVTTSQFEISGKNHISQNVCPPERNLPVREKEKVLEQAASRVLPTDPLFTLFYFINPSLSMFYHSMFY